MGNTGETKNELVLRELKVVKEKNRGKRIDTFAINIFAMVSDCIDVIEDLGREIQIMRDELMVKNSMIDSFYKQMAEEQEKFLNDSETLTADGIRESLSEELRTQLRGDICE